MSKTQGLTFRSPVEYRPRRSVLAATIAVTLLVLGIALWVPVDNPVTGAVRPASDTRCAGVLYYYAVSPLSDGEKLQTNDGVTLEVGHALRANEDGSQAVCLLDTGDLVVEQNSESTITAEGQPTPLWRALWPGGK